MSQLRKQTFFSTASSYLGVAIGYVNYIYLFPLILNIEQFGLFRVVQDMAILFTPIGQAGIMQATVRFYPAIHKKKTVTFNNLSLLYTIISLVIFGGLFWLFRPIIASFFIEKAPEVTNFLFLVFCLIVLMVFTSLLEAYFRINLKVAAFNFSKDVMLRVLMAIFLLCYYYDLIDFTELVYSLLLSYGLILLYLFTYLIRNKYWQIDLSLKPWSLPSFSLKSFIKYGLVMIFSAGGLMMIGKIDFLMISAIRGLEETAIYTVAFYIATIIELPKRTAAQLVLPLYSKSIKKNNMAQTEKYYRQSAVNMFIVALLVFIGIAVNLDPLFALIPKGEDYSTGKLVIFFVGLAKVVDSAAGLNGELIIMSKYYRFIIWTVLLLAILTISSNLVFIPMYGIDGAAFATLLTLFLYNLSKYLFIYKKFGFQPFNYKFLIISLTGGFSYLAGTLASISTHPVIIIGIRSVIVLFLYSSLIIFFKVSPELNTFLKEKRKLFI